MKSLLYSKTFWLTGVAAILTGIIPILVTEHVTWQGIAIAAFGALAVYLRKITDSPIK